jgi:hypothetical protein
MATVIKGAMGLDRANGNTEAIRKAPQPRKLLRHGSGQLEGGPTQLATAEVDTIGIRGMGSDIHLEPGHLCKEVGERLEIAGVATRGHVAPR